MSHPEIILAVVTGVHARYSDRIYLLGNDRYKDSPGPLDVLVSQAASAIQLVMRFLGADVMQPGSPALPVDHSRGVYHDLWK